MSLRNWIVLIPFLVLGPAQGAWAKLSVVTTTTDLRAIAEAVGGDDISVESIAKGTQDPHFIEAKPSYMTKVSHADLVVSMGLELEIGWLPSILRGARNPAVMPNAKGNLELGTELDPLEVPTGTISRAQGDVHPYGNPHWNLDPVRVGKAAVLLADKLGELDSAHAAKYKERAKAFQSKLDAKTKEWTARIRKSGVTKIVTYHKTLTYFFDRFKLENPAILEPKPGIPPTSGHILEVIGTIRDQKIPLIMVENFFDPTVTNRIKESVPEIRVAVVPVEVDGAPGINNNVDLLERLVSTIEGK